MERTDGKVAIDGWRRWIRREWVAEFAGTALLLFAVVSTLTWMVRAGPPLSDLWVRLPVVAVVAGAVVVVIAYGPLGRRSGAHLNPAVTLGLWIQDVVGTRDLLGYGIAQCAGGIVGVAAARVWGAQVAADPVHWAVIRPAPSISPAAAALVEAAATAAQLLVVYALLTSPRYRRWAAVVAGVLLSVAIVGLATVTGAAFNPARALGPDVLAGIYPSLWVFVVGPLVGAAAAGAAVGRWGRPAVTGKLHHDPSVPCRMRCALPHLPAGRDDSRMTDAAPGRRGPQ